MGHHLARPRDSGQLREELRLHWKEQHERGLESGVPAVQVSYRSGRPWLSTRLCLFSPVTCDLSLRCPSTRDCYLPAQNPTEEIYAPEAEPLALHCQKWGKVGRALAMTGNARPCWPLRHHLVSGPGQSHIPKIKG